MTGKQRTKLPKSSARQLTPGSKPTPPRPKGEIERIARRRRDAMKYRLAGASYRTIAEKLTEEKASEYAAAHGASLERAMNKNQHISVRTVWDDVTAEFEELRRETEVKRADLMALENARMDQLLAKALSLFAHGSVPARRLPRRDLRGGPRARRTRGRRTVFVTAWTGGRHDSTTASRAPHSEMHSRWRVTGSRTVEPQPHHRTQKHGPSTATRCSRCSSNGRLEPHIKRAGRRATEARLVELERQL